MLPVRYSSMRLDIYTLVIICVCAIAGYLVFDFTYQEDSALGQYTVILPINDEVDFYNISQPSHDRFDLSREKTDLAETIHLKNRHETEEFQIFISPVKDGSLQPTPYSFPPMSEERLGMYLVIILTDSALVSIAVVSIYYKEYVMSLFKKKSVSNDDIAGNGFK